MAYFKSSESNFDLLELKLKAPNAELEVVAREAEVLQRFNPSQVIRGGFSELGAPGKYRNGPYTFAHIYLDQP